MTPILVCQNLSIADLKFTRVSVDNRDTGTHSISVGGSNLIE